MNRSNLISLLVLDAIVMILAAGLIYFRYTSLKRFDAAASAHAAAHAAPAPVAAQNAVMPEVEIEAAIEAGEDQEPAPLPVETRNIGFVFRHSKASRVQIIGDFNNWMPQSMKKGADNKWTLNLSIPPGEYAYNFVVDGKPIRDPNNPKVCDAGRGFPNSYLKVKPLAHDQNITR